MREPEGSNATTRKVLGKGLVKTLRTARSQCRGRGFESLHLLHTFTSSPSPPQTFTSTRCWQIYNVLPAGNQNCSSVRSLSDLVLEPRQPRRPIDL